MGEEEEEREILLLCFAVHVTQFSPAPASCSDSYRARDVDITNSLRRYWMCGTGDSGGICPALVWVLFSTDEGC